MGARGSCQLSAFSGQKTPLWPIAERRSMKRVQAEFAIFQILQGSRSTVWAKTIKDIASARPHLTVPPFDQHITPRPLRVTWLWPSAFRISHGGRSCALILRVFDLSLSTARININAVTPSGVARDSFGPAATVAHRRTWMRNPVRIAICTRETKMDRCPTLRLPYP